MMADNTRKANLEELLIRGGLSNPANWHKLIGPLVDSNGKSIPLIGGEIGEPLKVPLKYCFLGFRGQFIKLSFNKLSL